MGRIRAVLVGLVVTAAVATSSAAGAAVGYDLTNPSSTGCVSKGLVEVAGSARTYGAFTVKLRRSTGCNTVWAVLTRTDGKRCQNGGINCGQVRLTRTRADGTKTATAWRKMTGGTTGVISLQLNGTVGARYVGSASTVAGKKLGDTATLTANANGTWTVS